MLGFYTEADYENSIIELFQNMGYRYVYAPDLERDFRSPLYEEELDMTVFSSAIKYIEQAEVLIIGGTSLSVYPAANLIRYFRGKNQGTIRR